MNMFCENKFSLLTKTDLFWGNNVSFARICFSPAITHSPFFFLCFPLPLTVLHYHPPQQPHPSPEGKSLQTNVIVAFTWRTPIQRENSPDKQCDMEEPCDDYKQPPSPPWPRRAQKTSEHRVYEHTAVSADVGTPLHPTAHPVSHVPASHHSIGSWRVVYLKQRV